MPTGLRFLAVFCLACFLFLPMAFVDNMFITQNQIMTLGELWSSGGGPALFFAGIVFPLSGFGFFYAQSWSRYTYLAAIVPLVAWSVFHSIYNAPLGAIWFVCSAWYLFGDKAARAYFAHQHLTSRSSQLLPARRNSLRFVAIVAIISVILDATEPFVFHRAFDALNILHISVALLFLILYQAKSRWAWHLVVAWLPFTVLLYWLLRLGGYARYQPHVHSLASELIGVLFQFVFLAAVLVWLLRVRERYFRYIEDSNQQT